MVDAIIPYRKDIAGQTDADAQRRQERSCCRGGKREKAESGFCPLEHFGVCSSKALDQGFRLG